MNREPVEIQNTTRLQSTKQRRGTKIFGVTVRAATSTLFLLALSSPALATIETIRGTLSCFGGCNKNVRVFTFLTRGGCFVSPPAADVFEDPPFTVRVDTAGVLPEAAANQNNNSRNY